MLRNAPTYFESLVRRNALNCDLIHTRERDFTQAEERERDGRGRDAVLWPSSNKKMWMLKTNGQVSHFTMGKGSVRPVHSQCKKKPNN